MQTTISDPTPRRSSFKLGLDLVMAITFALLLNAHVLGGLSFHEAAGTLIGLVFAVHVFLNWSWVVGTTATFRRSSLAPKIRFGYLLNWILLIVMGVIVISGLLISRVLVPWLRVPNARWIQGIHITLGFLVLAVVGVHVGLHWGWIASITRRIVGGNRKGFLVAGVLGLLAIAGVQTFERRPSQPVTIANQGSGNPGRGSDEFREARPSRADHPGHEGRRGRGRGFGSSGVWNVLGFYLGILSFFALVTVQTERWLERRALRLR